MKKYRQTNRVVWKSEGLPYWYEKNLYKASAGRVMYLTFDEYLAKWEDIAGIFAKGSVLKGSFDQYVQEVKRSAARVR